MTFLLPFDVDDIIRSVYGKKFHLKCEENVDIFGPEIRVRNPERLWPLVNESRVVNNNVCRAFKNTVSRPDKTYSNLQFNNLEFSCLRKNYLFHFYSKLNQLEQ